MENTFCREYWSFWEKSVFWELKSGKVFFDSLSVPRRKHLKHNFLVICTPKETFQKIKRLQKTVPRIPESIYKII